jgi:hypothetical protein
MTGLTEKAESRRQGPLGVAKDELLRRAEQAERHFHPRSDPAKHSIQYKG